MFLYRKELSSENLSEVVMTCCKDKFIRLWVVNKAKFVRKLRIPSKLHKGIISNNTLLIDFVLGLRKVFVLIFENLFR